MMKLRCPGCGLEGELPQFTQAAGLLALDRAAAAFGEDWPLLNQYLDCFQGKRPLQAERRLLLAKELYPVWRHGQFDFNHSAYRVDRPEFLQALQTTIHQVTPPLANHHYLFRVLTAAARQTSQRREREFKAREQGLGVRGQEAPEPKPATHQPVDPEFSRLVMRTLDMNLNEAERQQAKADLERLKKEISARNRADQTPWSPPPRRQEQAEEKFQRLEASWEENLAQQILELAGCEAPTKAEVNEIVTKLADPDWRAEIDKLAKAALLPQLPAAREAAGAALRAHLETKKKGN